MLHYLVRQRQDGHQRTPSRCHGVSRYKHLSTFSIVVCSIIIIPLHQFNFHPDVSKILPTRIAEVLNDQANAVADCSQSCDGQTVEVQSLVPVECDEDEQQKFDAVAQAQAGKMPVSETSLDCGCWVSLRLGDCHRDRSRSVSSVKDISGPGCSQQLFRFSDEDQPMLA